MAERRGAAVATSRTETELGSVRKCRIALRSGAGDPARPQLPDPGAFVPVPHRPVRRRQDVVAAPAVSVAPADAGAFVNLFGHDVSQLGKDEIADLRKRIGIVLQDFRLLDHMTTYENVALPFPRHGRSESSYRKEVIDLLKWVGLGRAQWTRCTPILSGGEKQRAAIARAGDSRPQLLLADEPTGSVDPTLGRRLLRLFIELNKIRHCRHHRHPRHCPDGPVRGASLRAASGRLHVYE